MLWPMLWSDSLFVPTWIYVEIVPYVEIFFQTPRNLFPFGGCSDCTWEWNSKEISSQIFLFAFAGASELLLLIYLLEFSRERLGTNSVWRLFGLPLGFAIPGDSFSGIPPCFPPVGVYLDCSFARNCIFPCWGFTIILISRVTTSITKWQIAYVPLDPVADYIHMLNLTIRLCVGWKTLPNFKNSNLNFKLKVQTQTWT